MKYSLSLLQPLLNARLATSKRSSSVTPLLITSRSRWVPASGAKVKLVRLTFCTDSAKPMEKLSTRSEGSDTVIFFSSSSSTNCSSNAPTQV